MVSNLDNFIDSNQPSDGVVLVSSHKKNSEALIIAIVPAARPIKRLVRLMRCVNDMARIGDMPTVWVEFGPATRPATYFIWSTDHARVKGLLGLVLQYLKQTHVMENPIVSDLR